MSALDDNLKCLSRTFTCIEFLKLLAEAMHFDAHNGIAALVEISRATEQVGGDVVFLDRVQLAMEVPEAEIFEQRREAWIFRKRSRCQDGRQGSLVRRGFERRLYIVRGRHRAAKSISPVNGQLGTVKSVKRTPGTFKKKRGLTFPSTRKIPA